jgi:flagellar motor protein MotB
MIFLILAALLAQPLSPAAITPPTAAKPDSTARTAKPTDEHGLGEVGITAQADMKIADLKPYFAPQIDPFGPVDEMLTSETYVLDDALYHSVDSMTIPQHFTHSSYLRSPVEKNLIYGDIMVFLPSFETRVATWDLVVSNSLGETVRRVTRKGQPPAVITWDGKTESGEGIVPGEVYSFTFNAYDAQGNQTRIPGTPQRVNGLVQNIGDEWVISIAADQLFGDNNAVLLDQAIPILDEVGNLVKERFKKQVVVYVYSEMEKVSAERCRVMQAELARRVVLPPEALKTAPRFVPGLQPKASKIEVHVL